MTVVLEVGVVVMVTVVLEVRVGGASREFLVVRFFFGGLALFFRGAPLSRFFKSPVMRLFCLSKECCIVFWGTAGVLVILNTLSDFFFITVAFALRCVSIYAVILVTFLEVPCCLCCASRGFPGSYGKWCFWLNIDNLRSMDIYFLKIPHGIQKKNILCCYKQIY